MRVLRSWIVLVPVAFLSTCHAPSCHAPSRNISGQYCDRANNDNTSGYWTQDSQCTLVTYSPTQVTISAQFKGPWFATSPAGEGCSYPVGNPHVTCRRICGDLAQGKQIGRVVNVGVNPPGYAAFDQLE